MKIFGSVVCAFIFTACVLPAKAQSASPQAPARDYLAPHDSRDQLPPVVSLAKSAVRPPAKPSRVAGSSTVCYAIRSYNYGPVDSLAEVPMPAGSSTCTLASDSHMKSAVVLLR